MILVGVGTYEKILRPTQNPTLAGMDPLILPPSLRSTTPCDETGISMLSSYFFILFLFIVIVPFEQQW